MDASGSSSKGSALSGANFVQVVRAFDDTRAREYACFLLSGTAEKGEGAVHTGKKKYCKHLQTLTFACFLHLVGYPDDVDIDEFTL